MSGYSGDLKIGLNLLHDGIEKTVLDWNFITSRILGTDCDIDLIVINFTDGSDTKREGFSKIKYNPTTNHMEIKKTPTTVDLVFNDIKWTKKHTPIPYYRKGENNDKVILPPEQSREESLHISKIIITIESSADMQLILGKLNEIIEKIAEIKKG